MRLLLLTDTHGDIDLINTFIDRERVDACIHCGDFGFYDRKSINRLSVRELRLRLKHSHLPSKVRKLAWKVSHEELKTIVAREKLLAGFAPYLEGEVGFHAPVYAVWGNHEDPVVIEALRSKEAAVENLFLLDEHRAHDLAQNVRLIGLGGNFYYEGEGLFAPEQTGDGGKVRASWTQYAHLMARERSRERPKEEWTLLVSHVSPGKVTLLERLSLLLRADLSIFGHMGPPMTHGYSLFTFCEPHEAMARSHEEYRQLQALWETSPWREKLPAETRTLIENSLEELAIDDFPVRGRGDRPGPKSVESRYFATQFLNLADAPQGWGVLTIDDNNIELQTTSRWRRR